MFGFNRDSSYVVIDPTQVFVIISTEWLVRRVLHVVGTILRGTEATTLTVSLDDVVSMPLSLSTF
jgi:hypothetical protein